MNEQLYIEMAELMGEVDKDLAPNHYSAGATELIYVIKMWLSDNCPASYADITKLRNIVCRYIEMYDREQEREEAENDKRRNQACAPAQAENPVRKAHIRVRTSVARDIRPNPRRVHIIARTGNTRKKPDNSPRR